MKDKLLIIGGHGAVGRVILKDLIRRGVPTDKLVIAGRSPEKMNHFLKKEDLTIDYRPIDVHRPLSNEVVKDIQLVIMCIDQMNTQFLSELIKRKIDYVDITANSDFIEEVNQLPETKEVSVVTSVGLAPGLTNLAAAQYIKTYQPKHLTIDILLGAGESHGEAAVHWMFDQINQPYSLKQTSKLVKNFTFKREVDFTPQLKNKATYNFNFSDQHILNIQYPNIPVTTYFGFDVNFVSNSLHWLNKKDKLHWLENKKSVDLLTKMMQRKWLGSDDFAIKVSSGENDLNAFSLYGNNEKEITGKIASYVAYQIYVSKVKVGISTIEFVCSLEDVISETPIKLYVKN